MQALGLQFRHLQQPCAQRSLRRRTWMVLKASYDRQLVEPLQLDGNLPPTVITAPGRRIVAVGDLHGDLAQTKKALRLAGVLGDENDSWIGGSTVLVQVGDILDRGSDEICIMSLLRHLSLQAASNGGAVYQINGNHETMNVGKEFHDVSLGGFEESLSFVNFCEDIHKRDWEAAFTEWRVASQEWKRKRENQFFWLPFWNLLKMKKGVTAREMLYSPGGPLALELSKHGVVLNVNGWLFAHGGVLPHHVKYGFERLNEQVSCWMRGERNQTGQQAQRPFLATKGFDSIVWSRIYSRPHNLVKACEVLNVALEAANAKGLVVGHTPQVCGANCECNGRVWRIDVGMSSGVLNAEPQVIEIIGDEVRVIGTKQSC